MLAVTSAASCGCSTSTVHRCATGRGCRPSATTPAPCTTSPGCARTGGGWPSSPTVGTEPPSTSGCSTSTSTGFAITRNPGGLPERHAGGAARCRAAPTGQRCPRAGAGPAGIRGDHGGGPIRFLPLSAADGAFVVPVRRPASVLGRWRCSGARRRGRRTGIPRGGRGRRATAPRTGPRDRPDPGRRRTVLMLRSGAPVVWALVGWVPWTGARWL
jgi:hypothetical protein